MKKVGVVLLNWHGWRDTIASIRSLASLDYPDYEIVVVDNASTDDSVARIRAAHPEVHLIVNDRNRGFGGGCNPGIRWALSRGAQLIWLLNNDAIVERQTLAALVRCAERRPSSGAVGSVIYHMDAPDTVQAWGGGRVSFVTGTAKHFHDVAPAGRLNYLTAASMLLRKEALDQIGLFDEDFFMYWEDVDLSLRLTKAGWSLDVAEDSRVWHKESASLGKRSPILALYFNTSAFQFFSKHTSSPKFPRYIGGIGRLVKAFLRRDFECCKSIFKALLASSNSDLRTN